MQQHQQVSGYHVVIGLAVALASMFMACGFHGQLEDLTTPEDVEQILNSAPYTSLTDSNRWTVYEVAGKLRVQHGYGCAQASRAAGEDYVGFRIQDMAAVPLDYGDTGAVFLNGWNVQYSNDDHHVQGLSSVIYNIIPVTNGSQFELHWEAGGVLGDENGDDAYAWCYWYTLVFWKRSLDTFDAVALQLESPSKTFVHPSGADTGNDTAVRDLPGAYTDPGFGPRAVLPRGFALIWPGTDHHVLQAGFDLGTPVISGNEIAWTSQTLLKDNDTRRDYKGTELVSVLSGQSVLLWQPNTVSVWQDFPPAWVEVAANFPLTPNEPISWCTGVGGTYQERQYSVQDVPFDYAVPVLAGWELGYLCSDHHVRHAGVWLTGFTYVKDPNAATGTLLYTVASILDDDSDNASYAKNKVSILGFNVLDGSLPTVPQQVSPPPDDPPAPPDDPPAPPDDPPDQPPACKPWIPDCRPLEPF